MSFNFTKKKINKSVLSDFLSLEKNRDCETHITAKKRDCETVKFGENFARPMVFEGPFATPSWARSSFELPTLNQHPAPHLFIKSQTSHCCVLNVLFSTYRTSYLYSPLRCHRNKVNQYCLMLELFKNRCLSKKTRMVLLHVKYWDGFHNKMHAKTITWLQHMQL